MTSRISASGLASACLMAVGVAGIARAALPAEIVINGERVFPESMTSSTDGSVFFSSIGNKMIYRAAPGSATAEPFVQPGTDGLQSTFGVYADNRTGTLWACSNVLGGPPGAGSASPAGASLYAFDLRTGAPKGHYAFPTASGFCNDIATTRDGTVYATDTNNMEVMRLKKGGSALEVWAGADGSLGAKGGGLDGISMLGNRIVVNELATGKLFSIPIGKNGAAGPAKEVLLDRPLSRPDGMRSFGRNSVLLVEGGEGGKLDRVTLNGDSGRVSLIKQGYPEGPVAVTVVGTTAYVCEGQLASMNRQSGAPAAAGGPMPFKATAVEVGTP